MARLLTGSAPENWGQGRLDCDPAFASALLCEGIDALLAGDYEAGQALLRDHIRSTIGFEALGKATAISPPVLRRMLRPGGNPYSRSLLDVIAYLQKQARIELHVIAEPGR